MTAEPRTIRVPDVLGGGVRDAEHLHRLIRQVPYAPEYRFDVGGVGFVRPYGVLVLLAAARRLAMTCGEPVRMAGMSEQLRLYLDRMDLFEICGEWMVPEGDLGRGGWERNPQTPNLLELTEVGGPADVAAAMERARRIFSRWLTVPDLNNLLRVLSELCSNIYQHSGDPHGCVLIQKYEERMLDRVSVCLAAGDLGCGVAESLRTRHGDIGSEPLDYLKAALAGRSSRATRGGLGLRLTEEIAGSAGGYLWLRSDTAALLTRRPGEVSAYTDLAPVGGTQVAVEIHGPLNS